MALRRFGLDLFISATVFGGLSGRKDYRPMGNSHDKDSHEKKPSGGDHGHHILSNEVGRRIFVSLLIFTIITVIASRINFGPLNFPIAMFIATTKALMVILFFMGLKYDDRENRTIFGSSFVFFAIFVVLTACDIFTRGDFKVKGDFFKAAATTGERFKKPWIATDEIKAHGKKIFEANCVICHGAGGMGDGAAAAALNPKPRNFTQDSGWKNGRKPSNVFGTLTAGLNSMPSFSTLSTDDRWAVSHYALSLGPKAPEDSAEDLKKVGFDPSKGDFGIDGVEAKPKRTIPIDFAIDRYVEGSTAK